MYSKKNTKNKTTNKKKTITITWTTEKKTTLSFLFYDNISLTKKNNKTKKIISKEKK